MRIRLVPNTGVQYIELPALNLDELKKFTARIEVAERGGAVVDPDADAPSSEFRDSFARLREPATAQVGDIGGFDDGSQGGYVSRTAVPESVINAAIGLDGLWVPLPFDVGQLWACVHLKFKVDGFSAVLAVDTTFVEQGNPGGVEAAEVGERSVRIAPRAFWNAEAVVEHVRWIVRELQSRPVDARVRSISVRDLQLSIVALADFLRKRGEGLRVRFEAVPEAGSAIPATVVLDLGNSRTCVLLKEGKPADPREESLELIYPDDPTRRQTCPFLTQFAFVRNEIIGGESHPDFGFKFLSIIRMGDVARSMLTPLRLDPRPLGLSSPKRYLWEDSTPVAWEWRLADRLDDQKLSPRIDGSILSRMNVSSPLKEPPLAGAPVTPNYPRLACTVWAIVEILEQAFRQLNSVRWRRSEHNAPLCERRREIRNLVIMHPSGMHGREVENYRRACVRACKLWSEFRTNPKEFCEGAPVAADRQYGVAPPQVQSICDEALAVQVCWLYGEVMHRHDGDVRQVVNCFGRKRGGEGALEQTLRLASIDIGGGTIDLAIADYAVDPEKPNSAALTCRRLFHDGISRAGDEIIRALLEELVFPAIVAQTRLAVADWNALVASSGAAVSEQERRERGCAVHDLWLPIAMKLLSTLETDESVRFKIGEIVGSHGYGLLERALPRSRTVVPLKAVEISVDQAKLRAVVRKAIGSILVQCADITDQYQCDLLVVGGKPSSNPAVREQIYSSMAVPPGQVVFLSEQVVGDWYPFARGGGKIGDAKTCGVVGGSLVFDACYNKSHFSLRVLPGSEPPAIVGTLGATKPGEPVYFSADRTLDLEQGTEIKVLVSSGQRIASRRIASDAAEAKPIYELRLKRKYRQAFDQNTSYCPPITVRLRPEVVEPVPEAQIGAQLKLGISDVGERISPQFSAQGDVPIGSTQVSAEEAMELVLKTCFDEDGHWIDSGQFKPLPNQEGGV